MSKFILRFFLSTLLGTFFNGNDKNTIPKSAPKQAQITTFQLHSGKRKFRWAPNSIIDVIFCKKMKKYNSIGIHLLFYRWQRHLKNKISLNFKGYKNKPSRGIFVCTDSIWNYPTHQKDVHAITLLMGYSGSSQILRSEIYLNTQKYNFRQSVYSKFLLQSLILHEFGHALGIIKHSINEHSIMHKHVNPYAPFLHKEDIARIKKLYQI